MRSVSILEDHRRSLRQNLKEELAQSLPKLPSTVKSLEFESMAKEVYLKRANEIEAIAREHGLSALLTRTSTFIFSRTFSQEEVGNAHHTDLYVRSTVYLADKQVKLPDAEVEALFAPESDFAKGLAVAYPAMKERVTLLNTKSAARDVERMEYRDGAYNRILTENTSGQLIDLLDLFPTDLVVRMNTPAPGKKATPTNQLPPKFAI